MTTVTAGERRQLVINPSKREIIVPKSERVFGTYGENVVYRKYFLCPRIIGNNIDLSQCFIFVNYISSSGEYGQYVCEDVEITQDNACITFSWLLTKNVFDENKDATIYFLVQAKQIVDEELTPVFSTKTAQGKSYAGIDSTNAIQEKYADVILQMLGRITNLEKSSISGEQLQDAVAKYMVDNPIEKSIKTNESLYVTADGRLAVKTADVAEKDNTLPISSGAVHVQIGNINTLLEKI